MDIISMIEMEKLKREDKIHYLRQVLPFVGIRKIQKTWGIIPSQYYQHLHKWNIYNEIVKKTDKIGMETVPRSTTHLAKRHVPGKIIYQLNGEYSRESIEKVLTEIREKFTINNSTCFVNIRIHEGKLKE
jgi:hypothetical protein